MGIGGIEAEQLGVATKDFAKNEEIWLALRCGMGQDRGGKLVPKLGIHMFNRIDAETINIKVADPLFVDIDHATDHFGLLGKQIVQPKEVAVIRIFAAKGGIAPVVIKCGIIEPNRYLYLFVASHVKDRCIRKASLGIQSWKGASNKVTVIKGVAVGVQIREVLLVAVTVFTFLILDYVGGVVGNDVEKDLHVAAVSFIDQGGQFGIRAPMRINLGKIGDPVAVVTSR